MGEISPSPPRCPKPDNRPEDAEVTNLLSISPEDARLPQDARPLNGLSRFMKPAP